MAEMAEKWKRVWGWLTWLKNEKGLGMADMAEKWKGVWGWLTWLKNEKEWKRGKVKRRYMHHKRGKTPNLRLEGYHFKKFKSVFDAIIHLSFLRVEFHLKCNIALVTGKLPQWIWTVFLCFLFSSSLLWFLFHRDGFLFSSLLCRGRFVRVRGQELRILINEHYAKP